MHAHGLVVFLVRELQIFPPIIEVLRQRSPAQNPQQPVGKSWPWWRTKGTRLLHTVGWLWMALAGLRSSLLAIP